MALQARECGCVEQRSVVGIQRTRAAAMLARARSRHAIAAHAGVSSTRLCGTTRGEACPANRTGIPSWCLDASARSLPSSRPVPRARTSAAKSLGCAASEPDQPQPPATTRGCENGCCCCGCCSELSLSPGRRDSVASGYGGACMSAPACRDVGSPVVTGSQGTVPAVPVAKSDEAPVSYIMVVVAEKAAPAPTSPGEVMLPSVAVCKSRCAWAGCWVGARGPPS